MLDSDECREAAHVIAACLIESWRAGVKTNDLGEARPWLSVAEGPLFRKFCFTHKKNEGVQRAKRGMKNVVV